MSIECDNKVDSRFLLPSYNYRLKTLKDWPYDKNALCTAEKLAESGFFHTGGQLTDSAQCFVCLKELEGWDPDVSVVVDDPVIEHKKHSPNCPLINSKPYELMTFEEGLHMDIKRYSNYLYRYKNDLMEQLTAEMNKKFKILNDCLVAQLPKRTRKCKQSTTNITTHTRTISHSNVSDISIRSSTRRTRSKRT